MGKLANFGGISQVALETSTATGLRSSHERAPQALRFQRDRTTTAERIADRWRMLRKIGQNRLPIVSRRRCLTASAGECAGDLVARITENTFVVGRLPRHHFTDDPMHRARSCACSSSVGNSSGQAEGSSTSWANKTARQAASGRLAAPKMQGRRTVHVVSTSIPCRLPVDIFDRQGYFDQLPALHVESSIFLRIETLNVLKSR